MANTSPIQLGPIGDIPSERLREWRNDERIYKWCRQYEPREKWAHDAWLASLASRSDVKMYGIYEANMDSLEPLGVCGLTSIDLINRHAEFSIYIDPSIHKRGYGKVALKLLVDHGFKALGLNHIFGETFDGNPARRCFEQVGFKYDGVRRKFYYREGRYIDAHLYSILREEWT